MTTSSSEFDPWPTVEDLLEHIQSEHIETEHIETEHTESEHTESDAAEEPDVQVADDAETGDDSAADSEAGNRSVVDIEQIVRVLGGMNVDPEVEDRTHVFVASTLLAQVVIKRAKADDETWDDVVQVIEEDDQPGLASALWVGLSKEAAARYPSLEQWTRSMLAGLRSDAATAAAATAESGQRGRSRSSLLVRAITSIVALAAIGWFAFGRTSVGDELVEATSDEVVAPTTDPPETGSSSNENEVAESDTGSDDEGEEQDAAAGGNDPCLVIGPLGQLYVDQATDEAIAIGWEPSTQAINILLDGGFVDTVPADTNQYVIEHRPLLPPPLPQGTEFIVEIMTEGGEPSAVCATTDTEPVANGRGLIGVYAPTDLAILDQTPTSLTVGWAFRPGADLHHIYLDRTYVTYGDGLGSTSIGDETEFTLLDLKPGTNYEIGVRRVEGFNQSGMTTITATTPTG